MKTRVRDLVEQGNRLFSKRGGLLDLWQTMALNFCPWRADFTTNHYEGREYASHLMTSRPVLAHRDLGNSLSSMLRPRGVAWFHPRTDDESLNESPSVRRWLDAKGDVMRRIMYDRRSQFVRSTKQGDLDFVAFGQTVISVDPARDLDGVLYRTWHLRDVAWCENAGLEIDTVHRDWKLDARSLVHLFPKTAAETVKRAVEKEPYKEIKCRHIVLPADQYDYTPPGNAKDKRNRQRLPFVSIYVDIENETILEEMPAKRLNYVIPRWQTVSGSQYAHSPATVTALPDARLLQQITLTLLESGQKAVDPPLKATREAVVGGVNTFAGGITWVDSQYDERNGSALEPLMEPSPGLSWGDAREEKIERLIAEAFYLNVINLPEATGGDKMTAYETQKRVEEYIRRALPLFEPMEIEYNGGLCEQTWNVAMDIGAFGSFEDMPPELAGRDINWRFESPLQASNDRLKSEAFVQSAQLLAQAAQLDPNVRFDFDVDKAFRDAMSGVAPADWLVDEKQSAALKQQATQAQQAQQAAAALAQGTDIASRMGDAVRNAGDAAQSVQQALVA